MTARAAKSSRGVADRFRIDRYAAVVRVVRDAGVPMTAVEIKRVLRDSGVSELDDRVWRPLQRRLRVDEHVVTDGRRYRWVAEPPIPSPVDVLAELVRVAGARVRASHVELVESALVDAPSAAETAARHQQIVIDGLRSLAELASEVEELAVNEASARALIHRVRSQVKLSGLEPIERAGEKVAFEPGLHRPIGLPIVKGKQVLVLRPGYMCRTQNEELLITKAAVQE